MANIKQKFIKPGRDFNYAEGVKVKAAEAIYKNQVVYVSGSSGAHLSVKIADADNATAATAPNGRLMIAKTNIPINTYGIVLPWRLVTDFNTLASSGIGAPVYLSETPGTTEASNLTFTAPTGDTAVIVVGRVTVDATAANGGAMMICPSAPELRAHGGATGAGAAVRPREALTFLVDFPDALANCVMTLAPFPIILTDAYIVNGEDDAVSLDVKNNAGASVLTAPVTATSTNAISRATVYVPTAATIAVGDTITVTRGGTRKTTDYAVITAIRA